MSTRTANGKKNTALSRSPQTTVNRDPGGAVLTGTGISFTSAGTISDSGNGLAKFLAGQRIQVRGSASNNGEFAVQTSAAGSLTVLPGTVTTEGTGPTVTITSVET